MWVAVLVKRNDMENSGSLANGSGDDRLHPIPPFFKIRVVASLSECVDKTLVLGVWGGWVGLWLVILREGDKTVTLAGNSSELCAQAPHSLLASSMTSCL